VWCLGISNVSPEAWFRKYPTLGSNGRSFVTDTVAVEDVLGKLPGSGTLRIGWYEANRLENALGLEPQSLQKGLRITRILDVAERAPGAPIVGNRFFAGGGSGLPGGGLELTIEAIPTGGTGQQQVTVVVQ